MKILYIANCHAKPLSTLTNVIAPSVQANWLEVNRLTDADRERATSLLEWADLVLYYPVADSWRNEFVRTSYIKSHSKQSKALTNVFFEGLHPDVTLVGKGGQRLQSPLSDYHSRTALFAFRAGLNAADACRKIRDPQFAESLGYKAIWQDSLAELHRRSDLADIHYAARFEEILYDRLPLFVINHPVTFLLDDYARFIMRELGISTVRLPSDCFPQWMVSNAIFPVFPYVSEWNSLPYQVDLLKAPKVDLYFGLDEFVATSFEKYKAYPANEMTIMSNYDKLWKPRFSAAFGRQL